MSNKNLITLSSIVSIKSIEEYKNVVCSIPSFTEDEEKSLVAEYYKTKDPLLAEELIKRNLKIVVGIAYKYKGYGMPMEDVIQEGNIGLIKSIRKYEPDKNTRIATYASYWIKAGINEYIIKFFSSIKVASSKNERKLFFKIRGERKNLERFSDEDIKRIALKYDVTEADVIKMEIRMYSKEMPLEDENKDDVESYFPVLASNSPTPEEEIIEDDEQEYFKNQLHLAMDDLSDREREILNSRWLVDEDDKLTLKDLGEKFGISVERVRQIEKKALAFIRKEVIQA